MQKPLSAKPKTKAISGFNFMEFMDLHGSLEEFFDYK